MEGGRKDEVLTAGCSTCNGTLDYRVSSLQVEAQDGDGIVSMETSPTDSNSAEIEGGVIPPADSGIYSSVGSASHHDLDLTHTQPHQEAQTQDPLLFPVATTPSVPSADQTSAIRSMQPSSLLAPSVTYNPIADLPVHLRESLPPPLPGSDCVAPRSAEFWLTPSHETLEKQVGVRGVREAVLLWLSCILLVMICTRPPPVCGHVSCTVGWCLWCNER